MTPPPHPQAKFMPHCGDSVLVTAARDGQVMYSVVNPSGELNHSKRVGHHNDSAHKVSCRGVVCIIRICLFDVVCLCIVYSGLVSLLFLALH